MLNRRTKAGLGAILLLTLLLAACGGGGVAPAEYVSSVCTAMTDFITEIQDSSGALSPDATDPAAVKDEMVSFLDTAAKAADTAISDIEAAGIPDVSEGQEVSDAIVDSLQKAKEAFEAARDEVAGMDTSDPAAFGTALMDVGTTLQDASGDATSGLDALDSEELSKAAEESEACQDMQGVISGA